MEEYRQIKGYEGLYEVSNMGNVLSLSRKTKGRWGKDKTSPGRLLKLDKSGLGYARISLSKNGVTKKYHVHRLVAEAFIPNPDNKPCVNHLDNSRDNNVVSNLEWATHADNTNHAKKQGRIATGERTNLTKLTEKDVIYIRQHLEVKGRDLAKKFGVTEYAISRIKLGKDWKHVKVPQRLRAKEWREK